MENLNQHREAMAAALNTIDGLFNQLQVTHREKEVARERFAECNYWLARLYGRLEQEYAARVDAANGAVTETLAFAKEGDRYEEVYVKDETETDDLVYRPSKPKNQPIQVHDLVMRTPKKKK